MYVANDLDLRAAYKDLIDWEKEISGTRFFSSIDAIIKKLKKGIRDYFKRENQNKARLVKWDPDGDGEIWFEELPEIITTKEAAEEWFMYHRYEEVTPSIYDCTGQLYTAWYKVFKRNGKYVVYHFICRDV